MISRRLPLSVAKAAVPQCHSLISLIIAAMRACYHRSNQVPVPTPHTTKPKKSALQKKEATTNEQPKKT